MRLVAQYNVQAELAPHEEESRRQEGQLIFFMFDDVRGASLACTWYCATRRIRMAFPHHRP